MVGSKRRPALTEEQRAELKPERDYNRILHIREAAKLYMACPQIMPFDDWCSFKHIRTFEEVYRG